MPLHFHFTQDTDAAQIQLFAKVVKCMLDNNSTIENEEWLVCTLPQEVQNLSQLYDICHTSQKETTFYITTPRYENLEYVAMRSQQIPNIDVNRILLILQPHFIAFKADKIQESYINLVDRLLGSFISINTELTNFFLNLANEAGSFSWDEKYGPCFFDRERFSAVRGMIVDIELQAHHIGRYTSTMRDTAKAILMSLLYQCGFLTFWCCLVDILSFPGSDEKEKAVMKNLSDYLLTNYANVYVYNIAVENNPIESGDLALNRGSTENTTRIKIYLTRYDDSPVLLRLDLPHKGCPYVHMNIEENRNNRHILLSNEAYGSEYDHVFNNLAKALLRYNFNVIDFVHSPVDQDEVIFRDMRYRKALLNYAPCSFYCLAFSDLKINHEPECITYPFIIQARNTLVELLEEGGYNKEELLSLDPPNLLEMAYKALLE